MNGYIAVVANKLTFRGFNQIANVYSVCFVAMHFPKMVVYNLAHTSEFDPYFVHGAILSHNLPLIDNISLLKSVS